MLIRISSESDMRLSWPQHLQASRTIELAGDGQRGMALALMGISLLILAQPARGVDIGAIETIHKKIIEARKSGIAILLVSSELEEIIALSTRIGCLFKGSIRHEFSQEEVSLKRETEHEFEKEIGFHIT